MEGLGIRFMVEGPGIKLGLGVWVLGVASLVG